MSPQSTSLSPSMPQQFKNSFPTASRCLSLPGRRSQQHLHFFTIQKVHGLHSVPSGRAASASLPTCGEIINTSTLHFVKSVRRKPRTREKCVSIEAVGYNTYSPGTARTKPPETQAPRTENRNRFDHELSARQNCSCENHILPKP